METALGLDAEGCLLGGGAFVGDEGRTRLVLGLGESLRGGTLVHNHPLGGPLSEQDLGTFLGEEIEVFGVASPEWTVVLRRHGWERGALAFTAIAREARLVARAEVLAREGTWRERFSRALAAQAEYLRSLALTVDFSRSET